MMNHHTAGRRLLIAALAFAFILAVVPTVSAATQVYDLSAAQRVGQTSSCCSNSYYNGCGSTKPGFQWSDTIPAGSTINSVKIEVQPGVQCTGSTYTFRSTLNGSPGDTWTAPSHCICCNPTGGLVSLNLPASAYTVGGGNTFLMDNPSSCQGFTLGPWGSGTLARVTVDYTSGGGGGGGCDLTPVLNKLNVMDAKLDALPPFIVAEHNATRNNTNNQANQTRNHVSNEADATRTHVTNEHDTTRALIEEEIKTYLVEQDLSSSSVHKMTATACLPEAFGGKLEQVRDLVREILDKHAAAGCTMDVSETDFGRGIENMGNGSFVKACEWFAKAYQGSNSSCP